MDDFELQKLGSAEELARTAAREWVAALTNRAAVQPYSVALSGGRIATTFLSAVRDEVKQTPKTLDTVHFFWADERCVPPDDSQSNFRLAREALFQPLQIPEEQIHRIRGEDPPEQAARKASEVLSRLFPSGPQGQPIIDLIFLGLGENGHVASLCPGEPEELRSSPAVYRPIYNSPKPPPQRITLGYPAIAAARQVWVLVAGSGKEEALRESLAADGKTPFARVLQSRTHTRVFSCV